MSYCQGCSDLLRDYTAAAYRADAIERDCGQRTDEPNPNGSVWARLNWWKDHADDAEARADALQRERDDALDDLKAARHEVDIRIALLVPTIEYLQDGETPAECIARNRKDIDALMTLLAQEKQRAEAIAAELEKAKKDAAYHADCRPNRMQAEAWRDDATAMNDKWADEFAARGHAEAERDRLAAELAHQQREAARLTWERDANYANLQETLRVRMKCAAELAALRAAAPLCEQHPPIGARSGCPICGLEALSAALSRIDYLCGEPNDMEVSGYDLHCDEQAVLKHVESRLAALRAGQAQALDICPGCNQNPCLGSFTNCRSY